jgi:lysozyme
VNRAVLTVAELAGHALLLGLISEFEQGPSGGPALTPYQDSAGVWTIGWGHTGVMPDGARVRDSRPITPEEAEQILAADLQWAAQAVFDNVRVPVTEFQAVAHASLAFNIGAGAYRGSTTLRLLNEGDYAGAGLAIQNWRKSGKVIQNGLVRRRGREEQLWFQVRLLR